MLLASASDGKVSLVGGVNGTALAKIKAGDVVAHVAAQIGGKGGGRAGHGAGRRRRFAGARYGTRGFAGLDIRARGLSCAVALVQFIARAGGLG